MNGITLNKSMFMPPRYVAPSAWTGHLPFAFWVIAAAKPRIFVELGTHAGTSYFGFCQSVLKNGLRTKCFAVDTWKGDEHAGFYSDDLYQGVKKYHDESYPSFSTLLRKTFDEAARDFEPNTIDLLHIDGLHTYDAVTHDYETWLPKLSSRGVVLFHDTMVKERNFGVWRLWRELSAKFPAFEFRHDHGLGVLVVGKDAPADVLNLCQLGTRSAQTLTRNLFDCLGQGLKNETLRGHFERTVVIRDRAIAEFETRAAEQASALLVADETQKDIDGKNELLASTLIALEHQVQAQHIAHSELSGRYQEASSTSESLIDRLTTAERRLQLLEDEGNRLLQASLGAQASLAGAVAKLSDSEQKLNESELERHALKSRYEEAKVAAEQARASFASELLQTTSRLEQRAIDQAAQLLSTIDSHERAKHEWNARLQRLTDESSDMAARHEAQLKHELSDRQDAETRATDEWHAKFQQMADESANASKRYDEQVLLERLERQQVESLATESLSSSETKVAALTRQLGDAQAHAAAIDTRIRQLLSSRSWRITKALRWAADQLPISR